MLTNLPPSNSLYGGIAPQTIMSIILAPILFFLFAINAALIAFRPSSLFNILLICSLADAVRYLSNIFLVSNSFANSISLFFLNNSLSASATQSVTLSFFVLFRFFCLNSSAFVLNCRIYSSLECFVFL